MPQYLFGFKCANPESCTRVRGFMGDEFESVSDAPKHSYYDHIGILDAENILKAIKIKKYLEIKAGSNLFSIEINAQ